MAFSSGAPNGEFASRRPTMAANIITTAAFLSDFIVPKYPLNAKQRIHCETLFETFLKPENNLHETQLSHC
jgi:hypothetical protein